MDLEWKHRKVNRSERGLKGMLDRYQVGEDAHFL